MSYLKTGASLGQLQEYVALHFQERGFEGVSPQQECLLLAEEVGELAKAIRKESGMLTDANSQFGEIAHELADILIVAATIANLYGIDLERAFRDKEAINHDRVWA